MGARCQELLPAQPGEGAMGAHGDCGPSLSPATGEGGYIPGLPAQAGTVAMHTWAQLGGAWGPDRWSSVGPCPLQMVVRISWGRHWLWGSPEDQERGATVGRGDDEGAAQPVLQCPPGA